jgi:hypothetical protein
MINNSPLLHKIHLKEKSWDQTLGDREVSFYEVENKV